MRFYPPSNYTFKKPQTYLRFDICKKIFVSCALNSLLSPLSLPANPTRRTFSAFLPYGKRKTYF